MQHIVIKQQSVIQNNEDIPFEPLARFSEFVLANPNLTLAEFEKATEFSLPLCGFLLTHDLKTILETLNKISDTLPHLIQIFRSPQTHLKELELIQDVDIAKRTTPKTLRYLIRHPEDWHSIKGGYIEPKRILTKQHEDDYSIYENVVFKHLIDKILVLLNKYLLELKGSNTVFNEMNSAIASVETATSNAYITLGKLYMAHFRTQDNTNQNKAIKLATKLIKSITPYLTSPVYKFNKTTTPPSGSIKLTHKLAMHKDYKYVYLLYNYLTPQIVALQTKEEISKSVKLRQTAYEYFCNLLTIFALTANGFSASSETNVYSNGKLAISLRNNDCVCTIKEKRIKEFDIKAIELLINNKKEKSKLSYLLLPIRTLSKKTNLNDIYTKVSLKYSDKYKRIIFLTNFKPKATSNITVPILPITLSDIHSFIRIQDLLIENQNK